jgi:protein-S-isoprenylcysteine O-methyltransferase Ste14
MVTTTIGLLVCRSALASVRPREPLDSYPAHQRSSSTLQLCNLLVIALRGCMAYIAAPVERRGGWNCRMFSDDGGLMPRHTRLAERLARLDRYRKTRMPLARTVAAIMFKLRAALMAPLLVVLWLCTTREWERDSLLWPAGLALFCAGVWLRVWSQRYLRYRLKGEDALTVAGPFAYVRNPVYLANTLLLVALTILCELLWMVPLTVVWCLLVYAVAVSFEEWRLMKRYGDSYLQYYRRVPRWIPHLTTGALCPEAKPASWLRAAAVEWQCLLLLVPPLTKEYFR